MLQFTVRLLTSWRNSKTIVAGLVASVTLGAIAFSLTFVSCIFLKLYAELGTNNTRTKQEFITNATKKSSDVLINTGVVLTKKPKSLSQLVGRGNRRIEVQRPLPEGI